MQGLLDQKESNADNLHNVRHAASRYLRNKDRDYLKLKMNELDTNIKNKKIKGLYRGINDFKKGW